MYGNYFWHGASKVPALASRSATELGNYFEEEELEVRKLPHLLLAHIISSHSAE